MRIDKALPLLATEFSRRLIRQAIEEGRVYINKKRTRVCRKTVRTDDQIELLIDDQAQQKQISKATAEAEKTNHPSTKSTAKLQSEIQRNFASFVLEETAEFLVINKPAGLATQPSRMQAKDNALYLAQKYCKKKPLFCVHRLDKFTSGVLVLAKTKRAAATFSEHLQKREIEKTYLAVIEGKPSWTSKRVESMLGKDRKRKNAYRSVTTNGKLAITEFTVSATTTIKSGPTVSLVKIKPITGRSHQIRVHACELGHCIMGDKNYHAKISHPRLMLHALCISFAKKTWKAPIPEEFQLFESRISG